MFQRKMYDRLQLLLPAYVYISIGPLDTSSSTACSLRIILRGIVLYILKTYPEMCSFTTFIFLRHRISRLLLFYFSIGNYEKYFYGKYVNLVCRGEPFR